MEVMIVNGNRYLINTNVCAKAQDDNAERILKNYPQDAIIEFDSVKLKDVI